MRIGVLASLGRTLDAFFPRMIQEWEKEGDIVFAAAGTSSNIASSDVLDTITRRPALKSLSAHSQLRDWVRTKQLDVLITNTATASAIARMSKLPVPVVYFCHGLHWNNSEELVSRPWQLIERSLLRNTDGIVTINSDDDAWFQKNGPNIPRLRSEFGVGVPLEKYPWSKHRGAGSKLMWAGEFSDRKRPFEAIRIAEGLRNRGVDFGLTMIGEGRLLHAAIELTRRLELESKIRFPGNVPFSSEMAHHVALVHTASWEGLPRVMLEAYAMGRHSYAYNVKGVRDVPGARLVHEGERNELVTRIAKFLTHDDKERISAGEVAPLGVENVASRVREFCLQF